MCGGHLSGDAGTFSFPNNPGHDHYDHEVSCAWVIQTSLNKVGTLFNLSTVKVNNKIRVNDGLLIKLNVALKISHVLGSFLPCLFF